MTAFPPSAAKVMIGTTAGPIEILRLGRENPPVKRSTVCVGLGVERAAIERDYHSFVKRGSGPVEDVFGPGPYRADVSGRIDAGSSWQLGFFCAHALYAAGRLAASGSDASFTIWATGTVRVSDLSVGEVGHVFQKLHLSLDLLREESAKGRQVLVFLPSANASDADPALRAALANAGVRTIHIDRAGEMLTALGLPAAKRDACAADKVWEGSPFRGLEFFGVEHRDIFFGRERAREETLVRLQRAAAKGVAFLLIHGRSGAGKSSLARAGLVGDIVAQTGAAGGWIAAVMTPQQGGASPLKALAAALVREGAKAGRLGIERERLAAALAMDPEEAIAGVTAAIGEADGRPGAKLLLVADQLEELFLWAREQNTASAAAERDRFCEAIAALSRSGAAWVIATMRSDLLSSLEDNPTLSKLAADDRLYRLERPSRAELKDIVLRPAAAARLKLAGTSPAGLPFEEVLVEAAANAPDCLPLLQSVLARLYEREGGSGAISYSAYAALGELEGAVGNRAEEIVAPLLDSEAMHNALCQVILALGRLDADTGTVVARTVRLDPSFATPDRKRLIDALVLARLAVLDTDGEQPIARAAHEALLNRWPRAKDLFEQHTRELALRERIETEALHWANRGEDASFLIRPGLPLEEAREIVSSGRVALTDITHRFIGISIEAAEAAAKAEREALVQEAAIERRRRKAELRMQGAVMMLIILGLIAFIEKDFIIEQKRWYLEVRPYIAANIAGHVLTPEAERALKPGQTFRECAKNCPEMVVIPAGSFIMGSPETEKDRIENEGPQHQVSVKRFAVGKFTVAFDEWQECVNLGDCPAVSDSGYGKGRRPVINVTWGEAKNYAAWLSKLTGKDYRLLTEAEWEYAARAGTTTAYSFGEDLAGVCEYGNFADISLRNEARQRNYSIGTSDICDDGNAMTAEVGSYKPNGFGLYDMHGNVFQWTADCYRKTYDDAPNDGAAVDPPGCASRVARGGSWYKRPEFLRSALRGSDTPETRFHDIGFRLARTLSPPSP